jgi:hypothetical protein
MLSRKEPPKAKAELSRIKNKFLDETLKVPVDPH